MTPTSPFSPLTPAKSCFIVLSVFLFVSIASAQNQQTNASPMPSAAQAQGAPAEQANFPPQLLEELSAIKAAALSDDYAYRQIAHLTENIGPRPRGSLQAKA